MHENREIPRTGLGGWHREVRAVNLRSTTAMNGCGKSDSSIVPVKPSNKGCGALKSAEEVEERGLTKGNLFSETSSGHRAGEGMDMVNPKRARSGKLRTQPRVSPTFGL
jgi:hypothetical protein